MNCIHLYILDKLHWWDYRVPIEEYLESFHKLVQKDKIRYIGEHTKRSENDSIAKSNYDKANEQDQGIVQRVLEFTDKRGVLKSL